MIGLERKLVRLIPYDPAWKGLFEQEKARLAQSIGHLVLDIQHVGSTAIPGGIAKPIVDIAIAIPNVKTLQTCVPLLEGIGYRYKGENGIPGRHYFDKGKPISLFHVHMSEKTHANWIKQIAFRDYLLVHPEAVKAYADLKTLLAEQYRTDREAYTEGKTEFIRSILESST